MGCREQVPINREVEKVLGLNIEEIDAVENPQYIIEFQLKMTPKIVILQDGIVRGRFERPAHPEQLKETQKKVLMTGNRRSASHGGRPSSTPLSA